MNQISEKIDIKDWYTSNFEKFESSLNGEADSYLHAIRKNAIEEFNQKGFPTTKNEEWKYTNVNPVLNYNFIPSRFAKDFSIDKKEIQKYLIEGVEFNLIVFVNGVYNKEFSSVKEKNLTVETLSESFKNDSEFIKQNLGKYLAANDGFTALNTAFAFDGAVIKVKDNAVIENPVMLLYLNGSYEENILTQPRNLIFAGKNSQVKFLESFHCISEKEYLFNAVTEIILEENAFVKFYKIQDELDSAFHINRTQVHQQRSSNFEAVTITLAGKIVRNDLNAILAGENSEAHMYGLYITEEKHHVDNHTLIDHAVANCHSNELYKGILSDESRAVFNGKVMVRKDAQKTLAYQSNKNLLLSKSAKIDTKPQLEIFADDVKCSHGATVGQLDESMVFYLQSRGISRERAISILINAFASDVVEMIKIEPLQEQLENLILEKLHRNTLEKAEK